MIRIMLAIALSLLIGPVLADGQVKAALLAKVQAVTATPTVVPPSTPRGECLDDVAPVLIRELGGIQEYRLPNAMQVLLLRDATQTTTTVNITYRVGSRYEAPGEYGMAHLLEHMLFKGTERERDIPGEMAKRGVRFNGTTTVDRTNYFASFNANPQTLQFLLALEADRMVNSRVAREDLDKEMTVVRNEFERGENQPFGVLAQRVNSVAYSWHPYGKSTIGPRSDIENVPIEKLQAFYKRYYRPDNATLLIAGDFDTEAALARIGCTFGAIAKPAGAVPRPYTVEPAQDGERSVTVRRVGGQPILLVNYKVPAVTHPDTPALMVLQMLMSLQPSGQVYKQLVESKLAVAAGMAGGGSVDPGAISAYAILPPDADVPKVESLLLDLVEGRSIQPFTESELARVRDIVAVVYRQQMKNPEALIQAVSGLIAAGDWRLLFQVMEDLPKVTLADVERVRLAYFKPANRTLGRYLPAKTVERVEIPAAPPLEQRLATLQGPAGVEEGEQLDPTPAVLESRMTRITLPSGIALQTLRKQARGNSVQLELQAQWGERQATFDRLGTGTIASLLTEGSARLNKQQVQDALIQLRASLNVSSGDQGLTLHLSAERGTLLPALALAAELLRTPLLPQDAFDRQQKAAIAGLQASRLEPETLRIEAIRAHYNQARGVSPGQPDYIRSLDDRINAVQRTTLDDLKHFHADYWSANQMRVSVVGALPEGLADEVEKQFGDWKKPAAPRFVRHIPEFVAVSPARFDAIARDKANAIVRLHQPLAIRLHDPDYPALAVAAHILGGGSLESRLGERLRQKDGLTYGINARLDVGYDGNAGALSISGSYAPANRERLLAGVQDELRRLTEQGITADELARAKMALLEGARRSRTDLASLASALSFQGDHGETWAQTQDREEAIAAVTVESANTAWRRHIKPDGFVISTAGDFK